MAKRKNRGNNDENPKPEITGPPEGLNIPQGYEEQTNDIAGFWDFQSENPNRSKSIHFIPLEVKLFDSEIEPLKPSALIMGKLVDPCVLRSGDDEDYEGEPGDLVGVWFKAGMAALKDLGGTKVLMYPKGELDTGKPNKMILFGVHSKGKGHKLPVTDDKRDKSRHVTTQFSGPRGSGKDNARNAPDQGADDVDF